jgi:Rieske Fe-S protein
MTDVTRRTAFALGGAAATTLGLAACTAGGSDNGSGNGAVEPTKDASGASSVAAADIPVGGSIIVQTGSNADPAIAIAQPSKGQFVAHTAVCTHQGCIVAAAGKDLQCPCHHSKFDAYTGKVVNGPASLPLDAVPVKLNGDRVEFTV